MFKKATQNGGKFCTKYNSGKWPERFLCTMTPASVCFTDL